MRDPVPGLDPNQAPRWLWLKRPVGSVLEFLFDQLPRGCAPRVYRGLCQASTHLGEPLRTKVRRFAAHLLARRADVERDYQAWIHLHERADTTARRAALAHIGRLVNPPLISVVVPVFNPQPDYLRAAIRSVQAQFYPHWELCIADDASTDPAVAALLRDAQATDARIKVVFREQNGHISAASNSALECASGVFVALMDHDDLLAPDALYQVALHIDDCPSADILYSDEDHIDDTGHRSNPYFKPDWDPELMLGQNLVNHLGVYRRSLLQRLGGFQVGMEGAQDYDLALRAMAETKPDRIVHIPRVLYHWRQLGRARSFSESYLGRCAANARRAVQAYLDATGQPAQVQPAPVVPAWNRVVYPVPDTEPLVSIIIPTRNYARLLAQTVEGVLNRTDYKALEVLIVDNGSDEPTALNLLTRLQQDPRVRVLRCPGPFNYSALNNQAVRESAGELILLLNNDIDVIDPGWLREMVSHAIRPGIGAVGAKLLYPKDTIQHGGVTVGVGGVAGHQYLHKPREHLGYFGQLKLVRSVSAVTGACLLLRRQAYLEVGGLDEVSLPVAFNDVDLCLRLIERGYRNLWTPHAELYHHESASRGLDLVGEKAARFQREVAVMRQRWGDVLDNDPYWNPNLSLTTADVALSFPPRGGKVKVPPSVVEEADGRFDTMDLERLGDIEAAGTV
ncbi:MAG TPA: glycosyltransferase family 2 protein [Rhodopila sp.]|nr:glycosyltransferase family 2 protein [Rhodopila sp.]